MRNLSGKSRFLWSTLTLAVFLAAGCTSVNKEGAGRNQPIAIIVMDPLAKELACACVMNYGQRDYHKLGSYLSKKLGVRAVVSFSDNLADSLSSLPPNQGVIVIAKQSVVERDAESARFKYHALCRLTDMDGSTTLTGFFVAKHNDTATSIKDLEGRHLIFGPANAAEKRSAAIAALIAAGIRPPSKLDSRETCADAAIDVVDSTELPPPVAVISSYALLLIEGCGSIKKGDLKILGRTGPVLFVTVFVSDSMPAEQRQKLRDVLLALRQKPKLLKAMESKDGFVPISETSQTGKGNTVEAEWPDWRGPGRDGHVPQLPARLPALARLIWKKPAMNGGLAGLSVAHGCVIVADRDPTDEWDVFRCLDADTGELRWLVDYQASGKLDYGQFPRATPVIHDGRVYLLGAFGDLRCVNLADGKVFWKLNYVSDLDGRLPKWGTCSTPLVVDDLLIVNPGGPKASLVALDRRTGRICWKCPGQPAAYAAFVAGQIGGRTQIVGYDEDSLGGWDVKTGERLWKLVPPVAGDFNVPTPIIVADKVVVSTENNGTRLYGFDSDGRIIPDPLAVYTELSPDTTTPVVAHGRVFGAKQGLHCLDMQAGLRCVWRAEDNVFEEHVSLFADSDSVLIVVLNGECLLISAASDGYEARSRLRLFEDDAEVYSHPALVRSKLYVRGPECICCFDLSGK